MKSLEEQFEEDNEAEASDVLFAFLDILDIQERGGGPEGLYYTHGNVPGEYLFRNLPQLLRDIETNKELDGQGDNLDRGL